MVTIKDIAREANVTPTTVSNVINGNHARVSQQTIDRVQAIIQKHHYVPNLTARTLVSNASRIIGVIVPEYGTIPNHLRADPFQGELIAAIEHGIKEKGYYLMLRSMACAADIKTLLGTWNVDGALILGRAPDPLPAPSIPTVYIDCYLDDPALLNVGLEDRRGGYLATRHLLEKGHRRIGFVSYGMGPSGVVRERFNGYRQALQEQGLPLREEDVFGTDFAHLIQQPAVTAVFCTADRLAVELMQFLRARGIRVPEDLSIVGFDDLDLARIVTPPLTTIHQDVAAKGLAAVALLVEAIQGRATHQLHRVLPVQLVERESVRDLNSPASA